MYVGSFCPRATVFSILLLSSAVGLENASNFLDNNLSRPNNVFGNKTVKGYYERIWVFCL